MKEALCRAFCDGLDVHDVPAGLAVRTTFMSPAGDPVGFYVLGKGDHIRIEDSGTVLPALEAQGLDFGSGSRRDAMVALLEEYAVTLDVEDRLFAIEDVSEADLAPAALRFVAFLLRVADFALMTEARVASTFRQDVKRRLAEAVEGRADLEEAKPIFPDLDDFPADFVLRAPNRPPVGVYVATGDERVMTALWVQMRAKHETFEECSIVALVEHDRTLTAPVRRQASNRLGALTYFRGDEAASIERIAREALGHSVH
jgi:hypothetical protein